MISIVIDKKQEKSLTFLIKRDSLESTTSFSHYFITREPTPATPLFEVGRGKFVVEPQILSEYKATKKHGNP